MIRRHFDQELEALKRKILRMGTVAEEMLSLAATALISRRDDREALQTREEKVNEMQIEIDEDATRMIALHQPVAEDLRLLVMAPRITAELERIADQSVNLRDNADHLKGETPPPGLGHMAEATRRMVRESLDAFVRGDSAMAQKVLEEDDEVDQWKRKILDDSLRDMEADSSRISYGVALVLASRNLERIADHATNIAEEVIYLVEGRDVRHRHELKARGEGEDFSRE